MKYFFINTDAITLENKSPHELWIKHECAFSGGPIKFGNKFRWLEPGDIVFMYANLMGVVAVGQVLEYWKGIIHKDPLVYTGKYKMDEYRIKVKWLKDIRNNPITAARIIKMFGSNPSSSLQQIRHHEDRAKLLFNNIMVNE